jgi:3-phenylpropionate/cinnamic acid dioxygenase small subunit
MNWRDFSQAIAVQCGALALAPDYIARKEAVVAYLNRLGYLLDEFDIEGFVDEFTDDGRYRLVPRENYERGLAVHVIDDTRDRLRYRTRLIKEHWHYEQFRETRTLWNTLVLFPNPDAAYCRSNFAVYQSDAEGATELHLVGVFEDELVALGGRWRIRDRLAILDTFSPRKAIVVPP